MSGKIQSDGGFDRKGSFSASMDPDISRWILEFLIRHGSDERTMKSVLSILPYSEDDILLQKMIILKTIEFEISNGMVSEKMLESIESIVLFDKRQGVGILKSIKDAYCWVAVDCAARFIKETFNEQDKFSDSIKRIWRERFHHVERAETADLLSDQMRNWKEEFEEAIWDRTICESIVTMNTRNEALKAVRVYLAEAWKCMGPSFLEVAAEKMSKSMAEGQGMANDGVNGPSLPAAHLDLPATGDKVETLKGIVQPKRKHVGGHGRPSRGGVKITDTEELNIGTSSNEYDCLPTPEVDKVQEALRSSSSSLELQAVVKDPLPDAIRLAETIISDMARRDMNNESSVENQNRMDVDEPSPSANESVEPIQTDEGNIGNQCSANESVEPVQTNEGNHGNQCSVSESVEPVQGNEGNHGNQCSVSVSVEVEPVQAGGGNLGNQCSVNESIEPVQGNEDNLENQCFFSESVEPVQANEDNLENQCSVSKIVELVQANEGNIGNQCSGHESNGPKPSLMKRNSTACTYEWDDSIDGSPKGSLRRSKRLRLSSPDRNVASPLRTCETKKFMRKRKIKKWSLQEECTLTSGVQKFGIGNWKLILNCYRDIFEERTEVDLKDKWRNMMR